MTFGKKFKELRLAKGLSQKDVATRSGSFTQAAVWKIENDKILPKADTLKRACLRGLQLTEDSPEWAELRALWASKGTGTDMSPQMISLHASKRFMRGNREVLDFFKKVSKLSPPDWEELKKAVDRPAVMKGLASLNLTYDESRKKFS